VGRAIAVAFAAEGARVALTGRREPPLRETADLLASGDAVIAPADLTSTDEITRAAHVVHEAFGGSPDILVNNAGLNIPRRYMHQLTNESARLLVDTNLTGPLLTSLAVLPGMREKGGGLIIQISSMSGKRLIFTAGAAYTAAKHGLSMLSQSINTENGIHNIRSTCICPGQIATPALANLPDAVSEEELARLLTPEDVAAMALHIATLPPHVCVVEVMMTPTYIRAGAADAKRVAALS
jgi:NAD(P)-dependent dehydrogenase (short-subunit alcohol dehydrogenase family)